MNQPPAQTRRPVRSFVMRAARMTPSQKQNLEQHWANFGLTTTDGLLQPHEVFHRDGDLVLEIGFGMGDSLAAMAKAAPEKNFIGVEVHLPGVGRLLRHLVQEGITNVRCYKEDAIDVLTNCIADASLHEVQLFFPDPWHKKKHHKRRLVQPPFAALVKRKLKLGGQLQLATDWQPYAQQMLAVMDATSGFSNCAGHGQFNPQRSTDRPLTKFERRGQRFGHQIWELSYRKTSE